MINNIKEATAHIRDILTHKGYTIRFSKRVNKRRNCIISTFAHNGQFWVIYKKDMFMSYANQFKNENGIGESINEGVLRFICRRKYKVLICYKDGKVYKIDPCDWLEYSYKHNTRRTTNNGEQTVSIPISKLIRWGN